MKNIIYEDDHIIVAYKPAGIATQTSRVGQQDMVSELKNYIHKFNKQNGIKKEPYLGLIHRLDQPVCGLLVFAKTKTAAAMLSHQLDTGEIQKYYYAIVMGKPKNTKDVLIDYLYKDGRTNMSYVVKEDFPEAKKAALEYRVVKTLVALEENVEATLLEIKLITGRHHQIRVQLSNAGIPILGDGKYGSMKSKDFSKDSACRNLALCAHKLRFRHPMTGEEMTFERDPEDEIFEAFLQRYT
ncbi:MAG: RluA family pseudouridine synthase [Lachnospiraceae bacterium]|nr:RluA family pseudouridine synthase [Lachnospiraceae bacterium]